MRILLIKGRAFKLGEDGELKAIGREPDDLDREIIESKGVIDINK